MVYSLVDHFFHIATLGVLVLWVFVLGLGMWPCVVSAVLSRPLWVFAGVMAMFFYSLAILHSLHWLGDGLVFLNAVLTTSVWGGGLLFWLGILISFLGGVLLVLCLRRYYQLGWRLILKRLGSFRLGQCALAGYMAFLVVMWGVFAYLYMPASYQLGIGLLMADFYGMAGVALCVVVLILFLSWFLIDASLFYFFRVILLPIYFLSVLLSHIPFFLLAVVLLLTLGFGELDGQLNMAVALLLAVFGVFYRAMYNDFLAHQNSWVFRQVCWVQQLSLSRYALYYLYPAFIRTYGLVALSLWVYLVLVQLVFALLGVGGLFVGLDQLLGDEFGWVQAFFGLVLCILLVWVKPRVFECAPVRVV